MKKIIPFKKEIIFKTNLSEITSISLEHTLQVDKDNMVSGEFIISGDYKMVDTSVNVESFSFNIPFEVSIDDKYNIDNVIVDIYDFYYEIINDNILVINIEVIVDRLEEKPLIEKQEEVVLEEKIEENQKEEILKEEFEVERTNIIEETVSDEQNDNEEITKNREGEEEMEDNRQVEVASSLFDNFDSSSETYTTYKIYVVREGDTLDLLIQNYGVTKEELGVYNNIDALNIGDKLIIPAKNDEED